MRSRSCPNNERGGSGVGSVIDTRSRGCTNNFLGCHFCLPGPLRLFPMMTPNDKRSTPKHQTSTLVTSTSTSKGQSPNTLCPILDSSSAVTFTQTTARENGTPPPPPSSRRLHLHRLPLRLTPRPSHLSLPHHPSQRHNPPTRSSRRCPRFF